MILVIIFEQNLLFYLSVMLKVDLSWTRFWTRQGFGRHAFLLDQKQKMQCVYLFKYIMDNVEQIAFICSFQQCQCGYFKRNSVVFSAVAILASMAFYFWRLFCRHTFVTGQF